MYRNDVIVIYEHISFSHSVVLAILMSSSQGMIMKFYFVSTTINKMICLFCSHVKVSFYYGNKFIFL